MGLSTTQTMAQALAVAADGIHCASQAAGTYNTSAVDMAKFREVLFLVDVGTMGASGTVDFKVTGCATSGGSYTAISGTSITQLTQAGGNGSQYVIVGITSEKLVSLGLGYRYVKGQLIVGTAASPANVTVLGAATQFEPANAQNPTAVVQTIDLFR